MNMPLPSGQLIRTYKPSIGGYADKKFQEDAEKLMIEGWRVQTIATTGQSADHRPMTIIAVYLR